MLPWEWQGYRKIRICILPRIPCALDWKAIKNILSRKSDYVSGLLGKKSKFIREISQNPTTSHYGRPVSLRYQIDAAGPYAWGKMCTWQMPSPAWQTVACVIIDLTLAPAANGKPAKLRPLCICADKRYCLWGSRQTLAVPLGGLAAHSQLFWCRKFLRL